MPSAEAKSRLHGLSVGLWGRHELYVHSLAALLGSRGATAHLVHDTGTPLGRLQVARVDVLLAESPFPSEVEGLSGLGPPVVALLERAGEDDVVRAKAMGASAAVGKNASLADLALAIGAAVERQAHEPPRDLTARQREVLELMAEGMDNGQIADRLQITGRTARAHVSAVLKRLGVQNRTQAAVLALRRGWLGLMCLTAALTAVLATWAATAPAVQAATPKQRLAARISAALSPVARGTSAWAADAETGEQLWALSPDRSRTPASVQKLFTTATALDRFSADGRFLTSVAASGPPTEDGLVEGSVYLKGRGDPSFDTAGLARLASSARLTGLSDVSGRVFGDETYFDPRRGLPSTGFRVSGYVGPLSALSFNAGTLRGFGNGFQSNPPLFVAQRMRAALKARGVEVQRPARAGRAPAEATELVAMRSPRLASLVRHTNQVSDNYYAEMLLKGLGAEAGRPGSTTAGATEVKRFQGELGVSTKVLDGSGLSRGNSASARAVGKMLVQVRGKPWFDSFYRSLPLAGRTGTLRKRMLGTAAHGRCRAKTGTLNGVSALAGYCRARGDRPLVFAVLVNGAGLPTARLAQDRVAAALAAYSG